MNSYLWELYMRKGPQGNKISLCLKKQNHITANPLPFCLLAESLLPPTQPQLESLYLQQKLLCLWRSLSTHCSLSLPPSLVAAAAAATAALFSSSSGVPHLCNLQTAKEENIRLLLDGVRVIFLTPEINRSSSAVSILLHFQVGGKYFAQALNLSHP